MDKKMRRTELLTGIALSAIVIINALGYFKGTVFSFPKTIISAVPFVSLLTVSVLFMTGKFRDPPARYIAGTLFALTALSGIWQLAKYIYSISPFRLRSYFLKYIACLSLLAAGSAICALTFFEVFRFRKKGSLILTAYIFVSLLLVSLIMNKDNAEITLLGLVLIAALCFFPENSSVKESPNLAGQCGFILFDLSAALFVIISVMHYFIKKPDFEKNTFLMVIVVLLIIAIVLLFLTGICLAPMLLTDKEFGNGNN